jgi:putative tryptophan/tyrosine transport system substrate-binding protein
MVESDTRDLAVRAYARAPHRERSAREAGEACTHRSLRSVLAVLSFAAAVLALPSLALGQAGTSARIGMLVTGPPPGEHACVLAFRQGLVELGYVEGRTHVLEMRWAAGRPEETFPRLGNELVRRGVDLVVAVASQGLIEARDVLSSVPVVMAVSSYPVERGLIASLKRPGGNITGMATFTGELYAKRIQLLAEALPRVSRVAVLRVAGDMSDFIERDLQAAARLFGLTLQVIDVAHPEDLPDAFQAAVRGRAQAIMTTQSPFFYQQRQLMADLALKHKLPSFSGEPMAAEAGILITHGASIPDSCRRAAAFADRILRGAKPAELPAEQPTRFELIINLRTARALGITVAPALLVRADRTVE